MSDHHYPAAQTVAPILLAHFTKHLEGARQRMSAGVLTSAIAAAPDLESIEAVIDAAFWASLRREEGYIPKISLALVPPSLAVQPILFDRPLPLATTSLVRVAPAVERPGIHLGVWRDHPGGELRVWGTARAIPAFCFVLEVAAPGLIVVKHHRGDGGKYVNVAVLEGDQIKVIDEDASKLPDCPSLLTSLLGLDTPSLTQGPVNVLVQLAVSMRAHNRGGALLVIPSANTAWRESFVMPIAYEVSPLYSELAELVTQTPDDVTRRGWEDALDDAVDAIAGLTAVDGATVLTDRYELMAFGAKIVRRRGLPVVEQVVMTEPVLGSTKAVAHPNRLGGTRHLSAAQFIHDQRDAVALVASQDGRFTVFAWSECESMVHAHRVETLLL